jgi:hypothetical protein
MESFVRNPINHWGFSNGTESVAQYLEKNLGLTLLNFQWENCSIFKSFYTDGGLNIMKPISPLLSEVAFKQYQEHCGGPHQGGLACSTKSAVGVLIEEVALHQYQECSRVLIEEVALHQYQECSRVLLMEEGAFHSLSTKSAAGCSSSRGLSISTKSAVGVLWFGRFQCESKQNKQTSFALKDG